MPPECARCGAAVEASQLDCSRCHALIHADELKQLAAEADEHERGKRMADAVATWRQMLALLPPASRQHAALADRIAKEPLRPVDGRFAGAGTAGALALGMWKLKAFVPMVVTMAVSFAAYWTAFGWAFAAGLILSIWIHEMGHVFELHRRGIAASLPMFIPGVGAFVRLKQAVPDAHVDARIGLAGPCAGLIAALACWAIALGGGGKLWLGLAQTGAMINLFNLTPLFTLDGARAFRALSRTERATVALALGGALFLTNVSMLWLPLIFAALATLKKTAPREGDTTAAIIFVGLIAALSLLAQLPAAAR